MTSEPSEPGTGGDSVGMAGVPSSGGSDNGPPGPSEFAFETNPLPADCVVPDWWANAPAHDGELSFEPTEVFAGYVVAPSDPLPDDDDLVTLYVESRDATTISGAIVFSSGVLPAPGTDPLHGYLPAEQYATIYPEYPNIYWRRLQPPNVWKGYALSLLNGTIDGTRVRFTVHPSEQWRTWCELLAGYPNGLCVPDTQIDDIEDGLAGSAPVDLDLCVIDGLRYDCLKFAMCGGRNLSQYCSCEGCGCSASTIGQHLSFDLQLRDSGELEGSILNGYIPPETPMDEPSYNLNSLVYLTPQSP
jgi:hypothetical protein